MRGPMQFGMYAPESQLLLKAATVPPPGIFTASRSPRGLDMVAKYAAWWFLNYDKAAADTGQVMESLRDCTPGQAGETQGDRLMLLGSEGRNSDAVQCDRATVCRVG